MTKQASKKLLSKADFMQLKPSVKTLDIPELGEVYIKVMTAYEREGLETLMQEQVANNGVRATIFVYSVCDAAGVLEFNADDIEIVKTFPASIVSKVYEFSGDLNALKPEAKEDAAKN
ncbi:hypothetical protein [Psychrobacter glaciei]|uniref:hypothetical protein n=1 Tax=Psychrobacter glaciei TaxID=619771 RepID=UPI001F05797F|nr:hypothetical protein [Psychrobacter glaciei]MCH1781735.1 hypothetical protein [Psychrobacter glaciei]